jgi:hypothetical protein
MHAGILLEGVVKDTNLKVKLINYYGPYADRVVFWEDLKRNGIFDEENLILGGDLNFTTSSREVWGLRQGWILYNYSSVIWFKMKV